MRLSRQDFALAVRSFARYPGFTITAVLSLALAIALNTTMYSVLDALVNPEIYARAPSRLIRLQIWGDYKRRVSETSRAQMVRELTPVFESMTYDAGSSVELGVEYNNRYSQVPALTVLPNYFDVMRIGPSRGRSFTDADVSSDMPPVIINERLAGTLSPDRDFPLGARIEIDGIAHPVIGVIRRGAPLFMLPPTSTPLSTLVPNLMRLRDGVSQDEAQRQASMVSDRFVRESEGNAKSDGFLLKRADAGQFHFAGFHFALIAAVIAVLIIACANLANLQLARGIGRSRELALRAALGASRRDIITQLMLESGTLAVAGLLAGMLATFWGMHLIETRIPQSVAEYVVAPRISWRLVIFAASACLVSTMLIGLYPAIKVSRVDPNELLKSGAGTGASRKHRQQYGVMVATEIALSLALVSGAAIVVRTAIAVHEIRIGFDPKPLSVADVYLRATRDTVISRRRYANDLLTSVRAIPDVVSAALYEDRWAGHRTVTVEQHNGPSLEIFPTSIAYRNVTPDYLRVYHLPVIKGRDFLDGGASEPEAIIDRRFAGRFWPGVDPIGLRIKLDEFKANAPWVRIVGVTETMPDQSAAIQSQQLSQPSSDGQIFVTSLIADSIPLMKNRAMAFRIVVRAERDPARMPVTLRRYIPRSSVVAVRTVSMEENMSLIQVRESHDFVASLFSLFAVLAVALAALGVYGIVNHSVSERKRELGVRLALGATARDIVYTVIRDGNPMVLAGVALGLYLIKKTVMWLQGFSFEGDQYDAPLFAAMAAFLFLTALVSALIPAWRATRIDPAESLRSE